MVNSRSSQSLKSDVSNESRNSSNNAKEFETSKQSIKLTTQESEGRRSSIKNEGPQLTDKEKVKRRITLAVLLIANLLNYMDRYTLAGEKMMMMMMMLLLLLLVMVMVMVVVVLVMMMVVEI